MDVCRAKSMPEGSGYQLRSWGGGRMKYTNCSVASQLVVFDTQCSEDALEACQSLN